MDIQAALFWTLLNILSTIMLAFYSMMEMAAVSFNKVRLQYYISKGMKQAVRLNYLLTHPFRLFGTTLIAVNIALVIGSECARQSYAALGLSADLAPLTQVFFVLIFGELAPMFAARHYAEHVAMLGISLVYFSAKLMAPFLWIVGLVSRWCNQIVGGTAGEASLYLNQEELQKILEEQSDELPADSESAEYSAIAANIFSLRQRDVRLVMEALSSIPLLPSNATIAQFSALLAKTDADFILLYTREPSNIVGIATPRDLLRAPENHKVRNYSKPPWFIPETTSLIQLLKQFRQNNENIALVLNQKGKSIGIVNLGSLLAELFGKMRYAEKKKGVKEPNLMLIEKTFPSTMSVREFHAQFGVYLDPDPTLTLAELIQQRLGHHPEKGESVLISPFELTVKETSLLDIKTISISTRL
jgi:CBS domain containing-hemolysin-like protein